ncbi:MAG: tetratricopeptide repeat protein [Calditrichaeota bacterium]|nr:tetratricopeptide repeat protein [Calditrichota bacterium]
MWLISAHRKAVLAIISLILILGCRNPALTRHDGTQIDDEERIIRIADGLLKNGEYEKARQYLISFKNSFPKSVYIDDAAYRLAYLHVIADSANPYFDYDRALKSFREFKQIYPKSNYSSACNNWLNLLYLLNNLKQQRADLEKRKDQLQKATKKLTEENRSLKSTLRDLDQVIKRNH